MALSGGHAQGQPKNPVEEKVPEQESRVGGHGQNQPTRHVEGKVPEKEGFLSKVKDSFNLTKHLGFVSDLDSPANQAAIAAAREKEEREGVAEVVPQAPLTERIKQGVSSVAATAVDISNGASGGVRPSDHGGSPEQAESFNDPDLPGADKPSAGDKMQEVSDGAAGAQDSEHSKYLPSWAHRSGQKEADPKEGKEGVSFNKWALNTAHKLGNVVASKDLTDDLPKKSNKNT